MIYRLKEARLHHGNSSTVLNYLCLTILLFGIFVRLVQYFSNRSLWGDETYLALNIVNRSYLELLQPLDYSQAAPFGFLWVEKLAIQLLGNSEYSLRLFPLIAGIVSLIALYKLGKGRVSAIAVPVALVLFACLRHPLYYATEVKQYSSDVMVALLLCLLLIPLQDKILGKGRTLLIGLLGTLAICLSHPAIFTLGGVAVASLVTTSAERRKAVFFNRLPAYFIWIASFGVVYFLTIANAMRSESLQNAWGPEYPASMFDIVWLLDSLGRFFYRPLGFHGKTDGIAIAVFVIGCIACFRKHRVTFLVLIAPMVATLTATYLHKYPFRGRLVLFLTPFFILIMAEGLAFLLAQFQQWRQSWANKVWAIAGAVLACLVLLPAIAQATDFLISPRKVQEIRPVIEYIKTHQAPTDTIYLNDGVAVHQFRYYADRYGYSRSDYVEGYADFMNPEAFSLQNWENFKQQTSQLQGQPRVWFLFSGLKDSQEVLVKPRLDQIGQELDFFRQPGAFTYLYQLE
jgi:hypothetical protein